MTDCKAFWEFDVDFIVQCEKPAGHPPPHRAEVEGNGATPAIIEWGHLDEHICPKCGDRVVDEPATFVPMLRYDPTPVDFDAEDELWARWREQLASPQGVPIHDAEGNIVGHVHGGPLQTPDSDDLAIPITIPTQEDPA